MAALSHASVVDFLRTNLAGTRPLPQGPITAHFTLSGEGDSLTINNLSAGQYRITITDANNPIQTVIDTIEIFSPPQLGVNVDFLIPSCFGSNDGQASAQILLSGIPVPSPGNEYSYRWNTTDTEQFINVSVAGIYAVTVTDNNGCSAFASATIPEPPPLRVLGSNTFLTDASCVGAANGEIEIIPTGGTSANGNYNFLWSTGLVTRSNNGLLTSINPDEYCVTVTDDNGCEFAIVTLSVLLKP
jgi:hypothetical protein